MNTDKTLTTKFCNKEEYPIWYYKEKRANKTRKMVEDLIGDENNDKDNKG